MSIPQSKTSNRQSFRVSKKNEWKTYSLIFQQTWMCCSWWLLLWIQMWSCDPYPVETFVAWEQNSDRFECNIYSRKSVCWVRLTNYDNQSKEWPQTLKSAISGSCEVIVQGFSLEKNKTVTGDSLLSQGMRRSLHQLPLWHQLFVLYCKSMWHSSLKGHPLSTCVL